MTTAAAGLGTAAERRSPARPLAVGGVAALVIAVHLWARWLQGHGHHLFVNWSPLVGHLDPELAWPALGAVGLAVAAIAWGPGLAESLPWRRLLAVCLLAAAAWAASLALTEGVNGVVRSPASPRDYLADVGAVGSPVRFLSTFVDDIDRYAVHTRSHPPGMVLVAWTLDGAGGGPAALAAIEILVGASAVPAALIALRSVAGEGRARAAAPFLALAPIAITVGSSGDAFFAGVGAWAITAIVVSTARRDRRGDVLALAGGVGLGAAAFLSYGLVLLAMIPVVVARSRRRVRPLAFAAAGGVGVGLAFLAAGFSWLDGLRATRVEYLESVARLRPYAHFLVSNVAAFAVVLGPAAVAALASGGEQGWLGGRARWLVGGALVALVVADVSGMSKAEVERVWLPFAVWVLLATSALPSPTRRIWFATNVGFGLALELLVRQPW